MEIAFSQADPSSRVRKYGLDSVLGLLHWGSNSLRALTVLSLWLVSNFASAASLVGVDFSTQPDGRFEIKLEFDATPPEPEGYNIEKPARISLDFPGVTNQLSQKKFTLSNGNASSAIILESGGRTRLILNLIKLAPYTTRIEGNNLIVVVGDSVCRSG